MRQRLRVGIHGLSPGWQEILEAIGVDWDIAPLWREIEPTEFSTLIVDHSLSRREQAALDRWIERGGSALFCGLDRRKSDRCLTLERSPGGDLQRTAASQAYFRSGARRSAVGRRMRLPSERVSTVDKGEIVNRVSECLVRLHAMRNLPMVRKRRFPSSYPAVFLFRIDSDYGSRSEVEGLARELSDSEIPASWFLHVEAHYDWLADLRSLLEGTGAEIGLHCYRHRTYGDASANRANVEMGLRLLEKHGTFPRGYAAPNGIWNTSLGEVLADEGFRYSSEFSFAWESLPIRPPLPKSERVNEMVFPTVQIPIHPISPGNLLRERFSLSEAQEHYFEAAKRMLSRQVPIAFYSHPRSAHFEYFHDAVQLAREQGASFMQFQEYADWWNRRLLSRIESWYQSGKIELRIWRRQSDVESEAITPSGEVLPLDQGMTRFDSTAPPSGSDVQVPAFGPSSESPLLPRKDARLRRHSLHDQITRLSR